LPSLFISYRSEDSGEYAWHFHLLLDRHFEKNAGRFGRIDIFYDRSTIAPGEDFTERLSQAVAICDALIAIIGSEWTSSHNPNGDIKLWDPDDWVCIEIRTALERNIRVIPVLVEGASMPAAKDLPPALHSMVRRQWIRFDRGNPAWGAAQLTVAAEQALIETGVTIKHAQRAKLRRVIVASVIVICIIATTLAASVVISRYRSRLESARIVIEANELYQDGRYEEAKNRLDYAIELDPRSPDAFRSRGNLYATLGKADLAKADFQTAWKLDPAKRLRVRAATAGPLAPRRADDALQRID
jgi:tetratricopeptide (TPR) repeat protein